MNRTDDTFFVDLFSRRGGHIEPGLDAIQMLLEKLGHPYQSLKCLHIAGTNGKGSVAAFCASILTAYGVKTGLYTSPHLISFTERFQINGNPIDRSALIGLIDEILSHEPAVEKAVGRCLTFFEISTAAAFLYFAREQIDIAVIETGMGGRWDATNVIRPLAALITPVSMDHCEYLGDTLEQIAAEKAGIIKQGVPVITVPQVRAVSDVLESTCREKQAVLINTADHVSAKSLSQTIRGQRVKFETAHESYPPVWLKMGGAHQVVNAGLALTAIETVWGRLHVPVSTDVVARALANTCWPCRLECVSEEPAVLLDGAHNPEGARVAAAWLQRVRAGREVRMLTGMMRDKDGDGFFRELSEVARQGWAVAVPDTDRTRPPQELTCVAARHGITLVSGDWKDKLKAGLQWAGQADGILLVCGSLFLAGRVREFLLRDE